MEFCAYYTLLISSPPVFFGFLCMKRSPVTFVLIPLRAFHLAWITTRCQTYSHATTTIGYLPSRPRVRMRITITSWQGYRTHQFTPATPVCHFSSDLHSVCALSHILSDDETHCHADCLVSRLFESYSDTLQHRSSLGEFRPSSSMFLKITNCRYIKSLTIGITRTSCCAVCSVPVRLQVSVFT